MVTHVLAAEMTAARVLAHASSVVPLVVVMLTSVVHHPIVNAVHKLLAAMLALVSTSSRVVLLASSWRHLLYVF